MNLYGFVWRCLIFLKLKYYKKCSFGIISAPLSKMFKPHRGPCITVTAPNSLFADCKNGLILKLHWRIPRVYTLPQVNNMLSVTAQGSTTDPRDGGVAGVTAERTVWMEPQGRRNFRAFSRNRGPVMPHCISHNCHSIIICVCVKG